MFFYPRSRNRPFHLGPRPLEALLRISGDSASPVDCNDNGHLPTNDASDTPLARAARKYSSIYASLASGEPAPQRAPLPDDLEARSVDIRGVAYFMDADQVGICKIQSDDWTTLNEDHHTGIVIVVEHGRIPESDNLAHDWVKTATTDLAQMRAGEIAACVAGHIRNMGYNATAHFGQHGGQHGTLNVASLTIRAGVAIIVDDSLTNPFLGHRFSTSVVSTDYELPVDSPLDPNCTSITRGLRYWWGINGARSGREDNLRHRRKTHLGRYPMEQVRRVDKPTTLINEDEVPQVPKRAAFFERAARGDLGEKAGRERGRFAFKTPLSFSQLQLIRKLVPHQDGATTNTDTAQYQDPAANAKAIKSLAYALGADMTGICEIPRYAWFSHKEDGTPIKPYHRYAVVMVIDQGFDTMEGASGDDWVSGAQSMRAYLRGAEIAGVMAEMLRSLGFPARSQTNADSDVLQIPLMLVAGLGELSRIGELVLNPFLGPRLKSVVLTVDMPLEVDKPVDFGLQYFCQNCYKCARECPCDAIPLGDKVMFNGYEIWKPDVERCTRYRLTNQKGSACGRCMKTCPLNKIVDADGAWFPRIASWLGINAMQLKPLLVPIATRLDDWLGNGRRNLRKKWWFDHEIVNGVTVTPKASNEREIDLSRSIDATKQKIAYYHANVMPTPDSLAPVLVNRKAALKAAEVLESPGESLARRASHQPIPVHYCPARSAKSTDTSSVTTKNVYAADNEH